MSKARKMDIFPQRIAILQEQVQSQKNKPNYKKEKNKLIYINESNKMGIRREK